MHTEAAVQLDQINEACDHLHSGEILARAILEYD